MVVVQGTTHYNGGQESSSAIDGLPKNGGRMGKFPRSKKTGKKENTGSKNGVLEKGSGRGF
jgi:hypothetical protein